MNLTWFERKPDSRELERLVILTEEYHLQATDSYTGTLQAFAELKNANAKKFGE